MRRALPFRLPDPPGIPFVRVRPRHRPARRANFAVRVNIPATLFVGVIVRIFGSISFLRRDRLEPFPNSGLPKTKTTTLRSDKDNHGFPVEKTAFGKRAEPSVF
jgi:hypothetical protein